MCHLRLAGLLAGLALSASGQGSGVVSEIQAALDPPSLKDFGAKLAVDDDRALILGVRQASIGFENRVYLYERDGVGWAFQQTIGVSPLNIAISGDRVALGETLASTGAYGLAVYDLVGGAWTLTQELPPPVVAGVQAGGSGLFALDGDRIYTSGYVPSGPAEGGQIFEFGFDGTSWQLTDRIVPDAPIDATAFGGRVAARGDTLVATTGLSDPIAIIFRHDGQEWVQELAVAESPNSESFVTSVAADEGVVVVGESTSPGIGVVRVYRHDGNSWDETQLTTATAPQPTAEFGRSVSVSDGVVHVSAQGAYGAQYVHGAVHEFRWDGANWAETVRVLPPTLDTANGYSFGKTIASDGEVLLIGRSYQSILPNIVFSRVIDTDERDVAADVTTSLGVASTEVGRLTVIPGGTGVLEARFEPSLVAKSLDNCVDFRWVTVQESYVEGGLPLAEDPEVGLLPAISPAASADAEPFVNDTVDWLAGSSGGVVVHDEGLLSRVVIDATRSPSPVVSAEFTTLLVATDPNGVALPGQTFQALAGFRWTYDGATDDVELLGEVTDLLSATLLANTALDNGRSCGAVHAGCPGFAGWLALSPAPLAACDSLAADVATLPFTSGGVQTLSLDAGPACAGLPYFLLGSISGIAPGIPFSSGAVLPLVPDPYFQLTLSPIPGVQDGFQGTLDALGRATATFSFPPAPTPVLLGVTFQHAYVARDGSKVVFASNPVGLTIVP